MIDITPIFYQLVHNISIMDYNQLLQTDIFNEFISYVYQEEEFTLDIATSTGISTIHFEDVNELFYGTLRFCKDYGVDTTVLEKALEKMESYVMFDDLSDVFTQVNL